MPAHAQQSNTSVEQRLEALERRNAELEQEVQDLKSRIGEPDPAPETEERASSDIPASAATDLSENRDTFGPSIEEARAEPWRAGLNPNGGGFFLSASDNDINSGCSAMCRRRAR